MWVLRWAQVVLALREVVLQVPAKGLKFFANRVSKDTNCEI